MATKSNEFAAAVGQILDDFNVDVQEAVAKAVEETGKKALKIVRAKSPARKRKGGGRYKKGWRMKKELGGVFGSRMNVTIYNAKGSAISHVLEKGHQKAGGGRVEGIPHVQPAYEEAERLLPQLTARAIEEATEK